jgi:hypothetical protein
MKKLLVCIMASVMLLGITPLQANAVAEPATAPAVATPIIAKTAETEELLLRLDEINEMDKSDLNFAEKKNLRKEVKSIKSELKERGDGVYISLGAALIIIILLIILL